MPTEVTMPKLGESVVEGTVGRWLKQPGDRVALYEALLEVETDKVNTEVPAPAAGVVRALVVPEGTTVRVGTVIAILEDEGSGPTKDEGRRAKDEGEVATDEAAALDGGSNGGASRFVSPVVARMAAEHRLDLTQISGTGLGGRVSKKDVERYLAERPDEGRGAKDEGAPMPPGAAVPAPNKHALRGDASGQAARFATTAEDAAGTPSPSARRPSSGEVVPTTDTTDADLVPLTPMRRAIAEHMERSVRTAPHVTTVFECDMGRVLAHRERHRADFERQGARLTLTAYLIEAIVAGVRAAPVLNSTWTDQGILQHRRAHVGVAVALDEGLIVPVVRDADEKSLLGIARTVADLAERARARRLQPGETQGGTITLTNHGTTGSLFATPIISQPQAAILGVGAVQKRPVVLSHAGIDTLAIRPMCYLSLTFDHRVTDGAVADGFLGAVKGFLEKYAG